MNPGPILIIRNTFPSLLSYFLFAALFNLKIQTYFSFLFALKTPKQTNLYRFYLVYFNCLVYFTLVTTLLYFYLHETLCLTTTRWSWGHKALFYFAGLLEEERER